MLCVFAELVTIEFDTGNPSLSILWSNTVRYSYNLGARIEKRYSMVANNPSADKGTCAYNQGDIVINRLDLPSEPMEQLAGLISHITWSQNS